jgi:D-glycero-D-manno-heptose 1,7-bisphosphate phosphatase
MLKPLKIEHFVSYNFFMNPAIFLDRDGVIIENRSSYVRRWEDVSFFPQAIEALYKLRSTPKKIIVITNQSCVGRGIIKLEDAMMINKKFIRYIENLGGRIDDLLMCPHAPTDNCVCRKPLPGLLQQAAKKHSLDLPNSIMIGDALSDIQAGQAAHVDRTILVQTGRGSSQLSLPEKEFLLPFNVHLTLLDACIDLFSQEPWWES